MAFYGFDAQLSCHLSKLMIYCDTEHLPALVLKNVTFELISQLLEGCKTDTKTLSATKAVTMIQKNAQCEASTSPLRKANRALTSVTYCKASRIGTK